MIHVHISILSYMYLCEWLAESDGEEVGKIILMKHECICIHVHFSYIVPLSTCTNISVLSVMLGGLTSSFTKLQG